MENLGTFSHGKCRTMCPLAEMEFRQQQRMLHILEMIPGTETSKYPKTDINHAVKSYTRSAAGRIINEEENLRPPEILLKTISYLLFDVFFDESIPWHLVYDFITDRLRAVRQDMIIQNVPIAESICLLEPMVRFHAYAGYKLCTERLSNFDPVMNKDFLLECLKKLLAMYDNHDFILDKIKITSTIDNKDLIENRPMLEALYLILNLGNLEALRRYLNLPSEYKTEIVQNSFEISISSFHGNYVRLCRLMQKLPPLLALVASLHLQNIRRKSFQVMSIAYSSKLCNFSVNDLTKILLYNSKEEAISDCKNYGFDVSNGQVQFLKNGFNLNFKAKPQHANFVDEKLLQTPLNQLIL